MKMTIGTDPELFATKDGNTCIPPVLLRDEGLPILGYADADKEEPQHPIYYKDDKIMVIEDGAAFEFTVPPSKEPEGLFNSFNYGKSILTDLIKPYGLTIYDKPTINFNPEILAVNGVISSYRQWCVRFGCDKDFDIYEGKFSENVDASKIFERYAGGHIHVSPIDHELAIWVTKLFDIFMGNTFIFNTPYPNEEARRQKYYGRPGKIRKQTYPRGITGIEYRTPSVSWLSNLDTVKMMYRSINMAMETMNEPDYVTEIINEYNQRSVNNILSFNQEDSKLILQTLGVI